MVDLPRVQERNITSEMATSAVTPGVIKEQAGQQAAAASSVADTLMDYSVEAAKKQASNDLIQQKVTRDADGNVQVLNPANSIFFGRAGVEYHAAVKVGTIAQQDNLLSENSPNCTRNSRLILAASRPPAKRSSRSTPSRSAARPVLRSSATARSSRPSTITPSSTPLAKSRSRNRPAIFPRSRSARVTTCSPRCAAARHSTIRW